MSNRTARRFHHLLLLNVIGGLLLFAVMTYFIVTGEYASLAERKSMEALLNTLAIGGLIYSAVIWMLDYFVYPLLTNQRQ